MPSRRQERVGKRVMQELVEAIRDLKHVELGFITVTKCEVSPDLRHAKVFVSVWGDEADRSRNMSALRRYASRLRAAIGRPLGTKVVPELHFELDESIANADRMSKLIRDARRSDVNPNPLTPEEEEALRNQAAAKIDRRAGVFAGEEGDAFEFARQDVEDELFGNGDDEDPAWRPINLDALPEDDER